MIQTTLENLEHDDATSTEHDHVLTAADIHTAITHGPGRIELQCKHNDCTDTETVDVTAIAAFGIHPDNTETLVNNLRENGIGCEKHAIPWMINPDGSMTRPDDLIPIDTTTPVPERRSDIHNTTLIEVVNAVQFGDETVNVACQKDPCNNTAEIDIESTTGERTAEQYRELVHALRESEVTCRECLIRDALEARTNGDQ